jgi:ADP-ribose pyrophosphatase YjhB (NUDIX family)
VAFTDPETWYASLPCVVVAAGGLITEPSGRVLLVKPNYRKLWALPGGICEQGEPPHQGCRRELAEELGLDIPVGRLLAVDWSLPRGVAANPIMHFVFDGGQLADGDGIVIQQAELDGYQFVPPAELSSYLPDFGVARVSAAIKAKESGATLFLPHEAT